MGLVFVRMDSRRTAPGRRGRKARVTGGVAVWPTFIVAYLPAGLHRQHAAPVKAVGSPGDTGVRGVGCPVPVVGGLLAFAGQRGRRTLACDCRGGAVKFSSAFPDSWPFWRQVFDAAKIWRTWFARPG